MPVRCAQYIRMSREHQKYSPMNQGNAIAAYAAAHAFEIARTYQDTGRSGLTLQGRKGLQTLLGDVISGRADFAHVLVLDVSRWGRFQDPDQGAHYEFLCREAGVAVHYCAEVFENDGSSSATIIKNLKRLMAAEFSRELGQKVWSGQATGVRLGFKQGGKCPFALRRLMIDQAGKPLRILRQGDRKSVQTDRVVLIHGPDVEIAAVRHVFRWFTRERQPFRVIAERLNRQGLALADGCPFTVQRVRSILRDEIYLGTYIWNKRTSRLNAAVTLNPAERWFRSAMVDPIVSRRLFNAARARLAEVGRRTYTDDELLACLRRLHLEHSKVTVPLIRRLGRPSPALFYRRWGSLWAALEAAGCGRGRRQRPRPDPELTLPKAQIISGLRVLLAREGYLCGRLIDADPALPTTAYVRRRFASLIAAYNEAGWEVSPGDLRALAASRRWRRKGDASILAAAVKGNA